MESKKVKKEKLTTTYIYDDTIDRVFNAYTDPKIYYPVMNDVIDEMKFLQGEKFSDLGTSAQIKWKNMSVFTMTVVSVENQKHYKKLIFKNEQIYPFQHEYVLKYSFYWNTSEYKTLFVCEYLMNLPVSMTADEKKLSEREQTEVYKKIEKYLKHNSDNLVQEESVIINVSPEKLWEVVTDWTLFKQYVPSIAENVIYDGEPLQIGSTLQVQHNSKNMEYILKIDKVFKEQGCTQWEFIMKFCGGMPKSPKQNLHFTFITINHASCLFTFKHSFREYVKCKLFKNISAEKKSVLSQLKTNLEKEEKDERLFLNVNKNIKENEENEI